MQLRNYQAHNHTQQSDKLTQPANLGFAQNRTSHPTPVSRALCAEINNEKFMNELLKLGSDALKKAALNEEAKKYLMNNEVLFNLLKKAADRYIGGETLAETVSKVEVENKRNLKCSIEFMGESTRTEDEARDATAEFLRISTSIKQHQLNSTISLDLSHIGLAISKDLCMENLTSICSSAKEGEIEVIISAEGVDRTDDVIELYKLATKEYSDLSITMQAYLHRSRDDFKERL